jgi:lysozyme
MNLSEILSAILGMFKRPAPVSALPPVVNDPPPMPNVPPAAPDPDEAWRALCRPLVQHFESCELVAYWDATGKVWTCGWGTTGKDVIQGTAWTQAQADARLDAGLDEAAGIVDRAVTVGISPQQKAALVSIVYNVGAGRAASGKDPGRDGIVVLATGQPSTLLRNLNMLNFASAADQFLAWNKSGGQVLNGLVRRRTAERSLFLTGAWK